MVFTSSSIIPYHQMIRNTISKKLQFRQNIPSPYLKVTILSFPYFYLSEKLLFF